MQPGNGNGAGGVVVIPLPAGPDGVTYWPLRNAKFPHAVGFLDTGYHRGYADAAGHVDPAYAGIVGYWHTGIDMNGPGACNADQGDGIYAARAGKIVYAQDGGGKWGPIIVLEVTVEGKTFWVRMAHGQALLKTGAKAFPKVGQIVAARQLLAGVGRGNPNSPWPCAHCHTDVFHTKPPSWNWWPTKNGPTSEVTRYCTDPDAFFKRLGAVNP